jgi:hypothetical protein
VANYPTLNPLYNLNSAASYITNANLQFQDGSSGNSWRTTRSTIYPASGGKWYFEFTITAASGAIATQIGVDLATDATNPPTGGAYNFYYNNANYAKSTNNGALTTFSGTPTAGDVIQIAYDAVNGQIWFGKNGTYFEGNPSAGTGASYTGINTNSAFYFSTFSVSGGTTGLSVNFGQQGFKYTPPTGFNALNTYNLPTPTIANGAQYMAASTWTGNGTSQTINNGTNNTIGTTFQPDFIWIKSRGSAYNNFLSDVLRGITTNYLFSDLTSAEAAASTVVTAVSSTGFSVGSAVQANQSATGIVGWQWKANGSGVSNTNGSITSTVSANTTAGFSVVTYTGNGTSGTVGHGLGVAPAMIIVKDRANAVNWAVWHQSIPSPNNVLEGLNTTAAATNQTVWTSGGGAYAPTSSVFNVNGSGNMTNNSGASHVAYCWAAVPGYSAFGSYTGNGSTDGPFVYTNMRPRYVLIKRTDSTGDWIIWDTSRDTYNAAQNVLFADTSDADTSYPYIDILSNVFKVRGSSSNTAVNQSGGTYVYACFSENPFNSSRAR